MDLASLMFFLDRVYLLPQEENEQGTVLSQKLEQETAVPTENKKILYEQEVLILIDKLPLSKEHHDFLGKILQAVKKNIDQALLLEIAEFDAQKMGKVNYLVVFYEDDFMNIPRYEVHQLYHAKTLVAHSLISLQNHVELKKKLWQQLKIIFEL